jgi:hypothetical protein
MLASVKRLILIMIFPHLLVSCVNVITTHTQGNAEDVVDANPSNTADVKPNIDIPVNGI